MDVRQKQLLLFGVSRFPTLSVARFCPRHFNRYASRVKIERSLTETKKASYVFSQIVALYNSILAGVTLKKQNCSLKLKSEEGVKFYGFAKGCSRNCY